MSRELNKATPGIKLLIEEVLRRAPEEFCNVDLEEEVFVTDVDRDIKVQVARYAQGRESLEKVNRLLKYAGLAAITSAENEYKVTWTLVSRHIVDLFDDDPVNDLSRAVDLGLKWHGKYITGRTKEETAHYLRLRGFVQEVAEQLRAEGRISFNLGIVQKDLPHYQEDPPYSNER